MKHNHRRTAKQNARKLDKMINHMYPIAPVQADRVTGGNGGRDVQRSAIKGSK